MNAVLADRARLGAAIVTVAVISSGLREITGMLADAQSRLHAETIDVTPDTESGRALLDYRREVEEFTRAVLAAEIAMPDNAAALRVIEHLRTLPAPRFLSKAGGAS
ncbi:MAG TPA: hypothetical protein PKE55_11390 [Kiritimatiellia bacterium]|nr:hypothetical protein [Kiritimatiellia bacterium]